MLEAPAFAPREVRSNPSTPRVHACLDRYLGEPLYVDCEYIQAYTQRHQEVAGWEEQERRAECHAWALEHLTPVIRGGELVAGSKTRFVRGAIPYLNYAADFVLRELRREEQESQDAVTDLGQGGGILQGRRQAEEGGYELFCHRFLIQPAERQDLERLAGYWSTRCMQAEGDRLWKGHYPHAQWIEDGWRAVLYTAPHDPAPEGRFVLDFETILEQGLEALAERCRQRLNETFQHPTTIEEISKVHFWRSAIRVLEATIAWGRGYGHEARRLAGVEADPQRRLELEAMAGHCLSFGRRPQTFHEALQHFWLAYLAGHIEGAHLGYSVGRFDRYLGPFLDADLAAGRIDVPRAVELLELMRIKHTELEYMASFSWEGLGSGNLFQNLILGGYTEDGQPADNTLSRLVLEAAIHTPTTQPSLSIWWTAGLSDEFLLKAAECVKSGVGFPAWFNTEIYLKHELQRNPQLGLGFLRKYAAMGGCTEPVLEGCSYGVVQPGFINLLKVFELALHGGRDPRTGLVLEQRPLPQDLPALESEFRHFLEISIQRWQEYWNIVMEAHARTVPLIFCSAVMRDCVERGRNMDRGGILNTDTPTTLASGMVNVANSLVAVREVLGRAPGQAASRVVSAAGGEEASPAADRALTLDDLREALSRDFQGHERLRRALCEAPKWGNDDDRVDACARELWDHYCRAVERGLNYLGRPYDPSMLAISTPAPFGKACMATPDGRQAGEPLADGVTSPHPGTDRCGPTAVLRSVQKLDHTRIRGGLHNMKFHPQALLGLDGSLRLLQLVKTMFETQTAFQIQFNVVDSRMLRDAQEHPERHRDLIVRVAGFSAFFVELGRAMQDQVIERTEYSG